MTHQQGRAILAEPVEDEEPHTGTETLGEESVHEGWRVGVEA